MENSNWSISQLFNKNITMSKKEATNPYKVHKGLKRVYLAFLNSTRGFYFVFREEITVSD